MTLKVQTRSCPDLEVSLFVVPHICDPLSVQPVSTGYHHLLSLDLADHCCGSEPLEVDFLMGSDIYWDIVTGEVVGGPDGPVALNTRLGWVLSGPIQMSDVSSVNFASSHTLRIDSSTEVLDKRRQLLWELESFGVRAEEDPVQEQFMESIQMVNGRYQVSLPWREYHEPLPTNHELSLKRLLGLLRRLKQQPEVLAEYDKTIQEQRSKGIVERVEAGDVGEPGRVHYLPHHTVIRWDKQTTKVRVVYDASSSAVGPSLNNCLHTGPKYNQILEILIRFRMYPVAVVADIEKAFLMISVDPRDRDFLTFLWVKDAMADELREHHVKKCAEAQPRCGGEATQVYLF